MYTFANIHLFTRTGPSNYWYRTKEETWILGYLDMREANEDFLAEKGKKEISSLFIQLNKKVAGDKRSLVYEA